MKNIDVIEGKIQGLDFTLDLLSKCLTREEIIAKCNNEKFHLELDQEDILADMEREEQSRA